MFSMYPHTITVLNRFIDRGRTTYYATLVGNVLYQDKQAVKTGNETSLTDNQGYVQIPYLNEEAILQNCYIANTDYVKSNEWRTLPNKELNWTLQEEDLIVKGSIDIKEYSQDEVDELLDKRTIVSIEDIDYTILVNNHYGVTLK